MIHNNKKRYHGNDNIVKYHGALLKKVAIIIEGSNNFILINNGSMLTNVRIFVRGHGHKLLIGNNCAIKGELLFEDDNCKISINDFTTIEGAHIAATESNSSIEIGRNCMLAQGIHIRSGDSHSIIDITTNKRINFAKNVQLGEHVWVGSEVKILKGVTIGSNTIIATGSIVTRAIPNNVIAAGTPAKVIRNNVTWDRKRIYD